MAPIDCPPGEHIESARGFCETPKLLRETHAGGHWVPSGISRTTRHDTRRQLEVRLWRAIAAREPGLREPAGPSARAALRGTRRHLAALRGRDARRGRLRDLRVPSPHAERCRDLRVTAGGVARVCRACSRAHQAASSNPAPPSLFSLHPRTLTPFIGPGRGHAHHRLQDDARAQRALGCGYGGAHDRRV